MSSILFRLAERPDECPLERLRNGFRDDQWNAFHSATRSARLKALWNPWPERRPRLSISLEIQPSFLYIFNG